jgi:exopolysaccharide biosynthesis predicted pyruvyltransferase EpsI
VGSDKPRTVAELRDAFRTVLATAIPRGSEVALLDFPGYPNVGDSAIWLGTVAMLRELDCRIAYVSDQVSYSRDALERRLPPDAPVLIQGGGNFGDLWPEHQRFRQRVIAELTARPIVQLPVSVEFRSDDSAKSAREALNSHERLTLLFRDEGSLAYAADNYSARSLLCPDAALGLTPGRRPHPDTDVVFLQRSDKEQLRPVRSLPGARVLDWSSAPGEPGHSWWWEQKLRVGRRLGKARLGQAVTPRLFDSLARKRVSFGYGVVGAGRVLVTDRLHGHILALLLGVPHVAIETGYGKIRDFHESFSRGIPGAVVCDEDADVEAHVRRLLATE